VPNVSEGRTPARVRELASAFDRAPLCLLDVSSDPDHHRSVLSVAGESGPLQEALVDMVRCALRRLDLRRHEGVHPRLGVVDVVPFVPVAGGGGVGEAVTAARRFGRLVGDELGVPVFLYGMAKHGAARRPVDLRRLGLSAITDSLTSGELEADYGPPVVNERSGVVLVGARLPLVAFNMVLDTGDVAVAAAVAGRVRESSGGLPGVQALGFELASRRLAQVSMNLLGPFRSTLWQVADRVHYEAELLGAKVTQIEVVGLVPEAALVDSSGEPALLPGLDNDKVLERALAAAGLL
jgi:glutamate formiminotransferase